MTWVLGVLTIRKYTIKTNGNHQKTTQKTTPRNHPKGEENDTKMFQKLTKCDNRQKYDVHVILINM